MNVRVLRRFGASELKVSGFRVEWIGMKLFRVVSVLNLCKVQMSYVSV